MIYYLKSHVTNEMLTEVGFVVTNYSALRDSNFKTRHKELNNLHAQLFICLDPNFKKGRYDYRCILWNYHESLAPINMKPYIQDLIDLGYVEIRL